MATEGKIARANRAMIETTMTAEEATAEARQKWEEGGRWTSKRYRLEGSRSGNSRLVRRKTAEQLRTQHGGTIVELIPRPPKRPKEPTLTKNMQRAKDLPECPKCGAETGKPCLEPSGGMRPPHRDREVVAAAVRNAKVAAIVPAVTAG